MKEYHMPLAAGVLCKSLVTDLTGEDLALVRLFVQAVARLTEVTFATQRAGERHQVPMMGGHVSLELMSITEYYWAVRALFCSLALCL